MVALAADEHIPQAVVGGLRSRGIDVLSAVEADLRGLPDRDLLMHCHRDGRTLLTNDHDFLRLAADDEHSGIIFLTSQFAGIGEIIGAVVRLVDTTPADAFPGHVFFVP